MPKLVIHYTHGEGGGFVAREFADVRQALQVAKEFAQEGLWDGDTFVLPRSILSIQLVDDENEGER